MKLPSVYLNVLPTPSAIQPIECVVAAFDPYIGQVHLYQYPGVFTHRNEVFFSGTKKHWSKIRDLIAEHGQLLGLRFSVITTASIRDAMEAFRRHNRLISLDISTQTFRTLLVKIPPDELRDLVTAEDIEHISLVP